jgi:LPS-assembly protein
MITRRKIFIMAARVCHWLLASLLLTTQLHGQNKAVNQALSSSASQSNPAGAPAKKASPPPARPAEPVTMTAQEQEKHGDQYQLRGDAEVDFRTYILRADLITYDDSTGEATATGHVKLDGGPFDEHLTASHGIYNVNTGNGRFWDVAGTTGVKMHGKSVMLTSSTPFSFHGEVVDKVGQEKLIVHHGIVTSCTLPQPKWSFHAQHITVVPGEDAKIYYSAFWLWRTPVFYFPFFTHPVEHTGPRTGLLMPAIGTSSTKGTIIGEGLFWAINRSMDSNLEVEDLTKRGWAEHVDFYARPDENSWVTAHYYGVSDRGLPTSIVIPGPFNSAITLPPNQSEGGEEGLLTAVTQHQNFRAVADVDYLSSYLYRAAFSDAFHQAANTEVRSSGFVTRDENGYSLNAEVGRYQDFLSPDPGNEIAVIHAPSLQASSVDQQIKSSPLRFGFDSAVDGLWRSEPDYPLGRNVMARLDFYPHLSLPLSWQGWTVRTDGAVRDTWYSNSLVTGGVPGETAGTPVNRHAFETQVEVLPPPLSKIFQRPVFHRIFKHTIEPRIVYDDVTGIDNFDNIPRFDYRDVYSNTNELEYALMQRLYFKPAPGKDCLAPPKPAKHAANHAKPSGAPSPAPAKNCETAPARELLSWEVAQKHYFDPYFGGALIPGQINVFQGTVDFTGVGFLAEPRNLSPVVSRLRLSGPNLSAEWQLDYDTVAGHITSSSAFLSERFPHGLTFGGGDTSLQLPNETINSTQQPQLLTASKYNQFGLSLSYGNPKKPGFAATANAGFDANLDAFQYSAVQATYNWDCCGLVVLYRRFSVGTVRDDHEYRFALSLANIGLVGDLLKQERLF